MLNSPKQQNRWLTVLVPLPGSISSLCFRLHGKWTPRCDDIIEVDPLSWVVRTCSATVVPPCFSRPTLRQHARYAIASHAVCVTPHVRSQGDTHTHGEYRQFKGER